jgi:hypothetical protein
MLVSLSQELTVSLYEQSLVFKFLAVHSKYYVQYRILLVI